VTYPDADAERAIRAEIDQLDEEIDALEHDADAFWALPENKRPARELAALLRRHRDFAEKLARLWLLAVEPRGRA
jgi:hypothetical protein